MTEEVFDVVDEGDEVTEQRTRSEVHRLGLRHRAVHVLVFNERGELFLQQRSLTKDTCPGVWDSSASGHLNVGESYSNAARRELGEELGLTPHRSLEFLFQLSATPATGMEFCSVYRLMDSGPFRFQDSEVRGGGWFFPWQIERWIALEPRDFASGFRAVWAEFNRKLAMDQ